jgi:hypothetical protein
MAKKFTKNSHILQQESNNLGIVFDEDSILIITHPNPELLDPFFPKPQHLKSLLTLESAEQRHSAAEMASIAVIRLLWIFSACYHCLSQSIQVQRATVTCSVV